MLVLLVAVATFCLPLVGSEDLYWRPNTDWNNPSNWKLGRVPCEGDVADFSSVPVGSVIRLDGDATVRSVVLPVGSRIELGKSLTLQFSNSTSCKINTANGPMVAPVEGDNLFIGAGPRLWEDPRNWEMSGGEVAKSPPCGRDRALFRKGHYYWTVDSNMSRVSVQRLSVRGELVTTELIPKVAPEFKLNLVVDSRCGEDPSLCPCPSEEKPSPSPTSTSTPTLVDRKGKDTSGQTAAIVVVVLILILLCVGLTVLLVVLWVRWRRGQFYKKDRPLGDPEDSLHSPTARAVSAGEGMLFDNPIYETEEGKGKKGARGSPNKADTRAHEMQTIAILRPSDYEPVTSSASWSEKKCDEYERI